MSIYGSGVSIGEHGKHFPPKNFLVPSSLPTNNFKCVKISPKWQIPPKNLPPPFVPPNVWCWCPHWIMHVILSVHGEVFLTLKCPPSGCNQIFPLLLLILFWYRDVQHRLLITTQEILLLAYNQDLFVHITQEIILLAHNQNNLCLVWG